MGRIFAALALFVLAACTTTQAHNFSGPVPPPPSQSTILVVAPDIQLNLLTAVGLQQPRADWTESARTNVAAAFAANLSGQGYAPVAFDPDAAMEGRIGQLIRLHEAVGASILYFTYAPLSLPTHPRDSFNWTLGEGAREIAAANNGARYALFIVGRGSYSSGGRVAATIFMAALGVGMAGGGQQMYASLVDLQSGDVIWFNVATASPNTDMRTPEGARALVEAIMKDSPL